MKKNLSNHTLSDSFCRRQFRNPKTQLLLMSLSKYEVSLANTIAERSINQNVPCLAAATSRAVYLARQNVLGNWDLLLSA